MQTGITDTLWIQSLIHDYNLQVSQSTKRRMMETGSPLPIHKEQAGYKWISPISGHNYAYWSLVDTQDHITAILGNTSNAWWQRDMLASSLLCTALLPQKNPFIATLSLIIPPVAITEAFAFYERNKWVKILKLSLQEQNEIFQNSAVVTNKYNGNVRAYMESQQTRLDEASLSNGLSIVTSGGAGFCLSELFFKGKYKTQSWPWLLTIGLFGTYAAIDNVILFFKYGTEPDLGGNVVGHQFHAMGVAAGVLSSIFLNC
jgi:hypothetical protein